MGPCLFGGGSVHQGPLYGAGPGCTAVPFGTGLGLCRGHLLFPTYRVPFGAGTPLLCLWGHGTHPLCR